MWNRIWPLSAGLWQMTMCVYKGSGFRNGVSWGVWYEVVGQCGNLDEVINALEVGELKVVSPKHLGD